MRIAICVPYQPVGGSFTRLVQCIVDLPRVAAGKPYSFILIATPRTIEALTREVGREQMDRKFVQKFWLTGDGILSRIFREQVELPLLLRRQRIDVAFCTANTMPWLTSCPCVVLYQNAAPFCHHPTGLGITARTRYMVLGRAARASVRRAARNIFTSEYLRTALSEGEDDVQRRSVVIGVPADARSYSGSGTSAHPYVLHVGHFYPYRHIIELMVAFDEAVRQGALRGRRLVLVGGHRDSSYGRRVSAVHAKLAARHRIELAGERSRTEVAEYMKGAEAFVCLSTCESSPQALNEAVALGIPTVTTRSGVMPEVTRDAAIYCDPLDTSSVADALRIVVEEEAVRSRLRSAAKARVKAMPGRLEIAEAVLKTLEFATVRTRNDVFGSASGE